MVVNESFLNEGFWGFAPLVRLEIPLFPQFIKFIGSLTNLSKWILVFGFQIEQLDHVSYLPCMVGSQRVNEQAEEP